MQLKGNATEKSRRVTRFPAHGSFSELLSNPVGCQQHLNLTAELNFQSSRLRRRSLSRKKKPIVLSQPHRLHSIPHWCWDPCRGRCCGCGCGRRGLAWVRIAIAIDIGGTQWRTAGDGGRVGLVLGPVLREAVVVFHVAIEVEPTVGIAEAPSLIRLGKCEKLVLTDEHVLYGLRAAEQE